MRFIENEILERIGFDFYCDIANNIVKARAEMGWTQKKLAEQSGIKPHRLVEIENVKIRIDLDDLEKLSKVLNRSVDWLLDAELEGGGKECLYLVWSDSSPFLKLYQRATSKRMAFMIYDRKFKECHIAYNSGRERHFVQLVGVPVSTAEIQKKFKKRVTDDLPIEPD